MANRIQIRRDTAANWTSVNPILTQGELGYEINTGRLKVGNGTAAWTALPYFSLSYNDVTGAPAALSDLTNDVGFITAEDIPAIPTDVSVFNNDAGYITEADLPANELPVNAAGYLLNDGSGVLTWASIPVPTLTSQLTNDSGFITAEDIPAIPTDVSVFNNDAGYITISDVPEVTVPTLTSELTNDSGFITSADIPAIPATLLDLGITDGTSGQVLTANGNGTFSFTTVGGVSNTLDGLDDVVITTPSTGQVLKFDGINWINDSDDTSTGSGIALTDLSVSVAAAGSSTLAYDNLSGVFTYTPPDLSGYALTSSLSAVATSGSYTDLTDQPTLFDGAYSSLSGAPTNVSAFTNDAGYITGYTETDPEFTASPASGITSTQITNWDTAYGWGDHSVEGYLTSYTETDPVFAASAAGSITTTDVSNWNTAFGWGDHAGAGYLVPTINTTSGTTASIADNASANLDLTGGRAYVLYKIQTSAAAWVRVYTSAAARTADVSRAQGVDPTTNSGVIAEVITAGAETVVFAPAVNGFNDEGPTTDVMPIAVTNLSGGDAAITVTVTKMTMVA
jgi:hypothetical protein